jgi:hypothetical protein
MPVCKSDESKSHLLKNTSNMQDLFCSKLHKINKP